MRKILWLACMMTGIFGYAQDSLNISKLGQLDYNPILNDIWGYAANNKEYALVGVTTGFSVVDVTTPANPVELFYEPGAYSTWRDIKTWSNYAYVVHDGYSGQSDGLMIVDLNTVNSANPVVIRKYPVVTLGGTTYSMRKAHNIYIDENGVLYIFGASGQVGPNPGNLSIGQGGALMFDLTTDPQNPTYLGAYDQYYLHDGMVRGDTLWGGAIYQGELVVVDVSNKSNTQTLGSVTTPHAFTHNAWISDDNKTIFTTDEVTDAYVAAYDVSDPSNITELDRIQSSLSDSVIPHNTHVKGDFLVTSYYTSGLQIVDATHPEAMIETGYYDTSPFTGTGFEGAWGAYPYLPSGNILVTDRQTGLFILGSSYPRGAYFSGRVIDSLSRNPIPNAQLQILNAAKTLQTTIQGKFVTAVLDAGFYPVVVSKNGYVTDTVTVFLNNGVETVKDIALVSNGFDLKESSLRAVEVSPNPSRNFFQLQLGEGMAGATTMQISDLSGKLVWEKELKIDEQGKVAVEHQLPVGSYTIVFPGLRKKLAPAVLIVQ